MSSFISSYFGNKDKKNTIQENFLDSIEGLPIQPMCVAGEENKMNVDQNDVTENTNQVNDLPLNDKPAVETPVEETPVEETPVEETPVEETPVPETPVEETPVPETPASETPVEETPVPETPVPETPVEETPVEETPVEETLVEETPVEETPVPETPVDETKTEEPEIIDLPPSSNGEEVAQGFVGGYMNKVSGYLPSFIVGNSEKMETAKKLIDELEKETDRDKKFWKRVELSKLYCEELGDEKNVLDIMALGKSQVGKTALVKRLFNISDEKIKLKGGTDSDTEHIIVYRETINGIDIGYADAPGYFDSRGIKKNIENEEKIVDHITNQPVDVIFWVSKVTDIVDSNTYNLLCTLIRKFGTGILKKMLVVLTYANIDPPDEYYENDNDENHLRAWKKFVKAKKKMWQDKLNCIQETVGVENKVNIPVVYAENNLRLTVKRNSTKCLRDGTPILETIMTEFLKLVKNDKAPIAFLALAGEDKEEIPPTPPSRTVSPKPKSKPAPQLNERQEAINNAVENATTTTSGSSGGWCTIL